MYLEYYGLKEPPFSITPDPRFVFLSERHRDALAHLLYGIGQGGSGGFVQLTGEVGTGKTTLCRLLLEQLPETTRVALVLNPKLSPVELIETLCEELHLDLAGRHGNLKALLDALNAYLLDAYAQGLRVVLIIDEAQELSREALEQVRLLTNLETPTQKLLQIILLGQPELRDLLARDDMRQLAQRITARFHLTPLDLAESEAYLRHRYTVAGGQRFPFTKLALKRLHQHSGGVPRLLNIIAERSLLAGYAHDEASIGERWVDEAAKETLASPLSRLPKPNLAVVSSLILLALLTWLLWPRGPTPEANAASANAGPSAAVAPLAAPRIAYLDAMRLQERLQGMDSSSLPAWNHLLALWTVRAEESDSRRARDCALVLAPGLYCLRGRSQLDTLAALGRPSLLRLRIASGERWALLLGADAVRVRLWLAGETVDVDRLTLQRQWNGEYATLWRAPAFLERPLQFGDRGAAVDWVRERLSQQTGLPTDGQGPALLDASALAAVRRLQSAHGLAADGVIGPETLFALSAGLEQGPRLYRVLE